MIAIFLLYFASSHFANKFIKNTILCYDTSTLQNEAQVCGFRVQFCKATWFVSNFPSVFNLLNKNICLATLL